MPFNKTINTNGNIRGYGSFEFYFVVALIGLLVLLMLQRYVSMVREIKIERFFLDANQFSSSAALANVHWQINRVRNSNGDTSQADQLIFSGNGWPLDVVSEYAPSNFSSAEILSAKSKDKSRFKSALQCANLWSFWIGKPISIEGTEISQNDKVQAKLQSPILCDFSLTLDRSRVVSFTYSLETGQITKTPSISK